MSAIKRIVGWLGGKAALYVLIVLAILASAFVLPWLRSEWSEPTRRLGVAERLEMVSGQLEADRHVAQQRLSEAASAAQRKGLAELDLALDEASRAKADAVARRRSSAAKAISLARGDADTLLRDGRLEMEIQYRDREIAGLSAARDRAAKGVLLATLPTDVEARLIQTQADAAQAMASCTAATQALAEFEDRWEVRATFQYYDQPRRHDLQVAVRERCRAATAAYRKQIDAAKLKQQRADATRSYEQARGWADGQMQAVTTDLEGQIAKERAAAEGSWRQKLLRWAERNHLSTVLRQAALALALIIAAPYLIRLACYFVLAPVAMRRPAIRVHAAEGADAAIPPADRSTTSVGVRLAADEELLVRHGYLQTSSGAGGKDTQWLLDWRHPITSLATGLSFLTRIRGEGEVTTVSATRDPFAEVTVMTLPDGASCVLQPRALAAVAQPVGRPLRVTAHWRLLSLNAWLTMQLRYLVFHGPARLVLQGGRGIRVERAERGRILGQDQVVGFSTDLAYSVTRTETFWPYFLGRESLLKDRVEAGEGVLIVEEAPMAGRRHGQVRRGIEGMIDAGMKVFGM
ncbi:MAG: hypothetical protein V4820_03515 [Pseudomonadota bacterium]